MKGYRLRSEIIFRDLNRLVSVFLAISPVRKIAQGSSDPLMELQERCAEDEIFHLLVSTAISNRLQMEHMQPLRDDPNELSFQPVQGSCGTLWRDSQKETETELSFREACNKIIHAESIEIFDAEKLVLRLFGTQRRTEWMAMVEVIDYARTSDRFWSLCDFAEEREGCLSLAAIADFRHWTGAVICCGEQSSVARLKRRKPTTDSTQTRQRTVWARAL